MNIKAEIGAIPLQAAVFWCSTSYDTGGQACDRLVPSSFGAAGPCFFLFVFSYSILFKISNL